MNKTYLTDDDSSSWTNIIEPKGKLFDLQLGELWKYRDLIKLFVKRDFISVYKQTILGPAWHIIKPLFSTVIFTIVFGRIAGISTDGVPQFLFYMAGNVIWTFFADILQMTSGTFINNAGIFGKVYFPRMVVPVSICISKLIAFGIQFLLFVSFVGYFIYRGYPVQPNYWIFITPILLLMMGTIGISLGVIVSALTTRYRDLQVLVTFGIGLLMYATPIVYPLSAVPDKFKFLILLNPITSIVETFRFVFLGAGAFDLSYLLYSFIFGIIFLFLGVTMFNKVERTFMDTI
jgi:lipopolysaccharide transport system permease protein